MNIERFMSESESKSEKFKKVEINKSNEKLLSHEKIEVYKATRIILKETMIISSKMGKNFKYTLGQTINFVALELAENIFLVYKEKNINSKKSIINECLTIANRLLINYRLAIDIQQLNKDKYIEIVDYIMNVISQLNLWNHNICSTHLSSDISQSSES